MAKKSKGQSWLEEDNNENLVIVSDSNGSTLEEGDNVRAMKDLKVKWAPDIKRGDIFKNIRLTDDPELIESGKMVLRTEFFKKQ